MTTPSVVYSPQVVCIHTGGTSCTTYTVPGYSPSGTLEVTCGPATSWQCHLGQ